MKMCKCTLIMNGHFIDCRDRRDLTPLHYACQVGNTNIAQLLVEHGSDVNSKGFASTTPLHIAVGVCLFDFHKNIMLFPKILN